MLPRAFPFIVAMPSSGLLPETERAKGLGDAVDRADNVSDVFLRVVGLFDGEVEVVETVERTDADEVARFATGASLVGSTGEVGARLLLTEGVMDFATDGGRRGMRGVEVPVVLTLLVDIVDATEPRRVRAAVLGVISDFAVSNVVDPSLVALAPVVCVDKVEEGREKPDGGRRLDGPAVALRIVEAVECADLTDAADLGLRLRRGHGRLQAVCVRNTGVDRRCCGGAGRRELRVRTLS